MTDERIIAIETSGRRGSAAVGIGPRLLGERGFPTDVEHARELLPCVDALCREHGWPPLSIRQVYVSIGPGSFTGLRVAVTFARHLALASGARICAVPTLDIIAENCTGLAAPPKHVAAILDAKRRQVYAAVFEFTAPVYQRIVEQHLAEPAGLLAAAPRPLAVLGEGVDHHRAALAAPGVEILDESSWWPRAAIVHALGWRMAQAGRFTDARDLVPQYVRRPEAEELWEKRQREKEGAQPDMNRGPSPSAPLSNAIPPGATGGSTG